MTELPQLADETPDEPDGDYVTLSITITGPEAAVAKLLPLTVDIQRPT